MKSGVLVLLLGAACCCSATSVVPTAEAPAAVGHGKQGGGLRLGGTLGGLVALGSAVPACRQGLRRLLGRGGETPTTKPKRADPPASEASSSTTAAAKASSKSADAAGATADPAAADSGEKFTLTPDRLATISELNPQLEAISDMLTSVPVFTAAVGNGTSPLTVPAAQDGSQSSTASRRWVATVIATLAMATSSRGQ